MTAGPRPLRSPVLWSLLALFVLEFCLFDHFGSRRFTSIYPRWNDQIQYLGEAYLGHEYARAHGLAAGLWQALVNSSAQGTLHDFFATLLFAAVGPSRSAALALNLLVLVAWQAALFFGLARVSGSRLLALAGAALPLTLCGFWDDVPGCAYDFRLDHLALCALGVTSAVGLFTDGFRSRQGSLAFGVAVGLTLLTRFLTGTYFIVILIAGMTWCLCQSDRKRRAANLALAALVAFLLAAPFFWINRDWVWNYYYIGHYVGPESAIRNQHFGLGQSLAFIWDQFSHRHLGVFFGLVAAGGAVALALTRLGDAGRSASVRPLVGGGLLFLLAPLLVLTLHQQKSEVVVGALAPGLILLILAGWQTAAGPAKPGRALACATAAIVLAAAGFFVQRQLRPAFDAPTLANIRLVNSLADTIYRRSQAANLPEARIAVDYITDSLDAQVLRVICYERHQVWRPFNMTLPTGIAEPTEAEVMARLGQSDFVFVTEDAPAGGFPFDQKLIALRPQLRAWCDAHLRAVDRFQLSNRRMILYQRREIPFP
ncbi:MAG: hypothetical protein NTV51_26260 [Verrucomicrobia bacterium]|nr:hypothetical protein [Verrucomicrobiota bacterium]